ncbi:MAG TPA: 3-isopropylmalate dehydratase [Polyangia bacterium]|jgi:3-isopropylmalate/(R)-2-methylmalate dehydratase small subunit
MSKPTVLRGRAWVVRDDEGAPIDSIDTDMIFHNAHLAITSLAQMGPLAFGNLKGWQDFPRQARPGDLLVVGENFGCGSSRQQAVDCFRALGIAAIVGESFGAIYLRNAINAGLPLMVCPGIVRGMVHPETGAIRRVESGDELELDLVRGAIRNVTRAADVDGARPLFQVQLDIYEAGDLLKYGARA